MFSFIAIWAVFGALGMRIFAMGGGPQFLNSCQWYERRDGSMVRGAYDHRFSRRRADHEPARGGSRTRVTVWYTTVHRLAMFGLDLDRYTI